MSEIIPINKGNYSMETPEREAMFEEIRGEGWTEEYRLYRKKWEEFPESKFVADYPQLIDLELSTICNLHCPMCYTITEEFAQKVKKTMMDFNLYKHLIDEMSGRVPALRLSLRGESTLHPRFIDCIRYAKDRGIREVSTLTNGSSLTEEFVSQIIDAGLDWITISIDGVGKRYEDIRRPLLFNDTMGKIVNIFNMKKRMNLRKPAVKIQTIWPAIRDNPEEYYNLFAPYVDLIAFNPLIDYLNQDSEIVYLDEFVCPQMYQRLVIGADGKAMACSNDEEGINIIGDANTQTIHEIWHGTKLTELRAAHLEKQGYKKNPVCLRCYLPRQTEESEKVVVNGRNIIVKNYMNRKQEIGK